MYKCRGEGVYQLPADEFDVTPGRLNDVRRAPFAAFCPASKPSAADGGSRERRRRRGSAAHARHCRRRRCATAGRDVGSRGGASALSGPINEQNNQHFVNLHGFGWMRSVTNPLWIQAIA